MIYLEGREQIELLSTYLYELTVYAIGKDRAELISSKFIHSKEELRFKKTTVIKKYKDYVLDKSIQLLGAPQEYIDRHCLKPIK